MPHILESLAGVATFCAGLWLLKELEIANNVTALEKTNPMVAEAMQLVDSLHGNESNETLKYAAYMAAKMRSSDEVMLQDSWNWLRSLVKEMAKSLP